MKSSTTQFRFNVTYRDKSIQTPYVKGCNVMAKSFKDMLNKFYKENSHSDYEIIAAMKME